MQLQMCGWPQPPGKPDVQGGGGAPPAWPGGEQLAGVGSAGKSFPSPAPLGEGTSWGLKADVKRSVASLGMRGRQ